MRPIKYLPFLFVLHILSCPPGGIQEPSPKADDLLLIKTAIKVYEDSPVYAFDLVKSIQAPQYQDLKNGLMFKIYLHQREYHRALGLLDSLLSERGSLNSGIIAIHPCEVTLTLIKNGRWERLLAFTDDTLLKGIAAYNLKDYHLALKFLSVQGEPNDYRLLYLTRTYERINNLEDALKTILSIDSISPYLTEEYENLLFNLLLKLTDPDLIERGSKRLKNEELKDCLLLKIYELQRDIPNLYKKSWELIKKKAESIGARYAVGLVKPRTALEYKLIGKVYYLKGDLENARENFKKAGFDRDVYYYLGRMYYERGEREMALRYLSHSRRADAYYYRGLIYEDQGDVRRAIKIYDSIALLYKNSKFASKGLRRRAFILEEIGDTNNAIKAFIRLNEKNTFLRAGLLLLKAGRPAEAVDIFSKHQDPGFIYWQMRTRNGLGQSADSLKNHLFLHFPYSYYSLIREGNPVVLDTMPMGDWLRQFGDSTVSFDREDSLHLKRAIRYFEIGEFNYGFREVKTIKEKSYFDLFYLSRLCSRYGADWAAIKFSLELKKNLEDNQKVRIFPKEFLKMVYPLRYIFTIQEAEIEPYLALSIIWQESNFDPNARSPADARGLMQIIPSTGKAIAEELKVSSYSLYDPETSIRFGGYYLGRMLKDFGELPLALAAYNAGPVKLRRWLKKGNHLDLDEFIEFIPHSETHNYVRSVLARQIIYQRLYSGEVAGPP